MFIDNTPINVQQRSKPITLPAPVGGLNQRDSLAAMPPTDAFLMDNIIPGTTSCKLRNGCEVHLDSPDPSETLLTFYGAHEEEMFSVGNGNIRDVSLPGASPVVKAGLLGNEVVSTMFATVADHAQWLVCATGKDIPFAYNGIAWSNLVITGTINPPQELNFVVPFKGRLYWGCEMCMGFYYLAPGAIQGAAEFFDLGQLCFKGGHVSAIMTYSEDAGDGPDDYIVFVTSQGEYMMFAGDDPGDASAWQLVGRYVSGRPIGKQCVCKYAGDTLIITEEGVLQFSEIRKLADTRTSIVALTSKLGTLFKDLLVFKDIPGWSITLYAKGGWLIVTAPKGILAFDGYAHFVMNTTTQAWCRIVGDEWNANCWAIYNRNLYYGRNTDGSIRQGDKGLYDNDGPIAFDVKCAYNPFGNAKNKQVKWAEIIAVSEGDMPLAGVINMDFFDRYQPVMTPIPFDPDAGAIWDVSYWDEDYWAVAPFTQTFVIPFENYGFTASLWLQGTFGGLGFEWINTKFILEEAEGLL